MPIKSFTPYTSVEELINDNTPLLQRRVIKPSMATFSYDKYNFTTHDIADEFLQKSLNWLPYQALCDISVGYILRYKNERDGENAEEYYRYYIVFKYIIQFLILDFSFLQIILLFLTRTNIHTC